MVKLCTDREKQSFSVVTSGTRKRHFT